MKALVECFIAWLQSEPSSANAWKILNGLAQETSKRVESPDPEQREFDVTWIAEVCRPDEKLDYETAKKWFSDAKALQFLTAWQNSLESFFRAHGQVQGLRLAKRASRGRYKTTWYLQPYYLIDDREPGQTEISALETPTDEKSDTLNIAYSVTKPGEIEMSWFGRLILGDGEFKTRSWRGGLWAASMIFSAFSVLACGLFIFQMRELTRPIQTGDFVAIALLCFFGWLIWRMQLRPLVWLLEDRISPASNSLVKLKEDTAHLDMAKNGDHRYIRLVRYSAVCPICAGNIELRYGYGPNSRRIFGCCSEVPTEHVFTFDRVTRVGRRYNA